MALSPVYFQYTFVDMGFISFRPNFQKAKALYTGNDRVTIYCYLSTPGIKLQEAASTGISVPLSFWDQDSLTINPEEGSGEKEFLKKANDFDKIKIHFRNLKLSDKINPTEIRDKKKWLKYNILKATDPVKAEKKFKLKTASISELFVDWVIENEKYRIQRGLVEDTSHYTTFRNRLADFEAYRGSAVKLSDMNEDFETEVLNYAKTKFAPETQKNFIKPFNRVAKWILSKKPEARKLLRDHWVEISLPKINKKDKAQKFTPTEKEINQLKNYIPNDKWGKRVKAIYLLNAEVIGWRISDFLRINPSKNIIEKEGYKFVAINPKKTDTTSEAPVYSPLLEEHLEIIKTVYPFPWRVNTKSQITDATRKFNKELKKLFRQAGIDRVIKNSKNRTGVKRGQPIPKGNFKAHEIVGSHSARRYRSNQLDGKIDPSLSKNIFGWSLDTDVSLNSYLDVSLRQGKQLIELHKSVFEGSSAEGA